MKPMIYEDTKQQVGKHNLKHQYFEEHGITVIRQGLNVGDYTLPNDQSVCVDTKKGIEEVCKNITGGNEEHNRFRDELIRAKEQGKRLIVLIEEDKTDELGRYMFNRVSDVRRWKNPNRFKSTRATTGPGLMQRMFTMAKKYEFEWQFCRSKDAGKRICEILGLEGSESG